MSLVELLGYLAPVLAIVVALLLGRYPGERALRRRLRRSPRRTRHPRRELPADRAARTLAPRGAALLAYALAGRAPPPAAE